MPKDDMLVSERLEITAVTVLVSATDAAGRPVDDLTVDDLAVLEDGAGVEVLELAPMEATARTEMPAEIPVAGASAPERPVAPGKELPVAIYVNRLLGGGSDQRLALRAVIGFGSLAAAFGPRGATVRVSVTLELREGEASVWHQSQRLTTVPERWIYTFPLEWPASSAGRLAVTVEELGSGIWGGAVANLPSP